VLIISSHIPFSSENNAWQHFHNFVTYSVWGGAPFLFIALQDGPAGHRKEFAEYLFQASPLSVTAMGP